MGIYHMMAPARFRCAQLRNFARELTIYLK
jgi:hypothetical protein